LKQGLFITFEGVEGAGKTTQIALLKAALERAGRRVCVTREPGGDAVAEGVRQLLLSQEMSPRAECSALKTDRKPLPSSVKRKSSRITTLKIWNRIEPASHE
jgi:dTMP kinase